MPFNRRSSNITQGVARAPKSLDVLRARLPEGRFDNPMIGIANGHSTITPCNAGLQRLTDAAVAALKASKANPQTFARRPSRTACRWARRA
ncbi:MAG: hypothetical protein WDN30_12140 [Pararobbsia sp.]